MASTAEHNDINPMYLDAIDKFTKEEIENANQAADYWYHKMGANVIPADTKIKKAWILKSWTKYQSSPVPRSRPIFYSFFSKVSGDMIRLPITVEEGCKKLSNGGKFDNFDIFGPYLSMAIKRCMTITPLNRLAVTIKTS
jgi:hypothetical protein